MTDLPPDARGAAPDFDAIRSPAPAAAPGEEPDSGNPAGGSPRGGARGGLARFRAVAARLTRPAVPHATPGHLRRNRRDQKRALIPGSPRQRRPANPPHPHRTVVRGQAGAASEPVSLGPERDPGPAGAPATVEVLPGSGPITAPPAPEPPAARGWPWPPRQPGSMRRSDGMGRSGGLGRSDGLGRPTASERTGAMAARFSGGWPFGRIIGVGVVIVALFSLLAIGVGGTALADLTTARDRVVNTLDPAAFHASQLQVDLLNQETGVRGYALSAQLPFLAPYHDGLAGQQQQVATLRPLLGRHAGRPGRSQPGAAAGRQLAGHLRPAHDQPGGCLRKALAGPR